MSAMPPLQVDVGPRRGVPRTVPWLVGAFLLLSLAQWAPWLLLAVPGAGSLRFLVVGLGALVFAAVVAWFCRTALWPSGRCLGLSGDRSCLVRVLTGFAVGALVYGAVFVARAVVGAVTVVGDGYGDGAGRTAAVVLLAGLAVAGYQAVSEEIVFRGALLGALPRRVSPVAAVAVSVGVFVLYHLPKWESLLHGPYALHLVLAGTAFAVAYLRTGSLWLGIGLHWGWNLGAYLLLEADQPLVRMAGPPASGWGEPGSWLAVAGNAVLLLAVLAWPVSDQTRHAGMGPDFRGTGVSWGKQSMFSGGHHATEHEPQRSGAAARGSGEGHHLRRGRARFLGHRR
jgi:membrane protease YdiL (CAAX protease family)